MPMAQCKSKSSSDLMFSNRRLKFLVLESDNKFAFRLISIIWRKQSHTCQYPYVITLLFSSKIVVYLRSCLNCMFIFLMPEIEFAFYKRSSRCDLRLSLENAPLILESSSSSSLPSSFTGTCSNSN